MATIQARIEGRVGESASGDDIVFTTTHMQDAYDHGLRAIIMAMPEKAWKFFGKVAIDFLPLVGTPLLTDKIISIQRRDGTYYRPCAMIEADMAGPAADSRSIHFASAFTPVYYVESGSFSNPTLKVLPEDGSKAAKLVTLAIPTVDITADTLVPHFPDELEELPEIYVVMWIKQREAGVMRRSSQDELEAITSSGYLASFEGSLPVFVAPDEPDLPTLTLAPMIALPTLSLSSATDSWPTFSESITLPTLVLPVMTDLPAEGMGAITVSSPGTLTMPTAPSLPSLVLAQMDSLPSALSEASIDFSELGAPVFESPPSPDGVTLPALAIASMDSLPSALSEADIDFSGVTSPSYITPTIGTAIGTLSISNKTITDPGSITLPDDIVLPVLSLTDAPSFSNLDLSGLSAPSPTLSYTTAGAEPVDDFSMSQSIPTYSGPAKFAFGIGDVNDALDKAKNLIDAGASIGGDEASATMSVQDRLDESLLDHAKITIGAAAQEVTRARTTIERESINLQRFANEVQESLGQFNAEITDYRAEVDELTKTAQVDVAAYTAFAQNNRNILDEQIAQYKGDLGTYQAEVNATVTEWVSEEVQFKLQKWQTQVQSEIGEHREKVSAVVSQYQAESNAKIKEYQAEVERQIREFEVQMKADTSEWTEQKKADLAKLQADTQEVIGKYQAEVGEYTADVRKIVDQYTSEARSDGEIYRANFDKLLKKFTAQNDTNIKEYQIKATAVLQEHGHDVQEYTAELNKALTKYRSELEKYGVDIRKAVDTYVAEARSDLDINRADYEKLLQKFTSQNDALIKEHQSETSAAITLYRAEIEDVAGEFKANVEYRLGEARFNLERETQEYQQQVNAFIGEYKTKGDAAVAEYNALVTAQIQDYQAKAASYRAQVEAYLGELRALNDSEISEFREKSGIYINEYQAKNTVLISEKQTEARALIDKYAALLGAGVQEFTGNLGKAKAYLDEAQVRLATMQSLDQKSVAALNESQVLQVEFDKKLGEYKAQFVTEPVFVDRRRT